MNLDYYFCNRYITCCLLICLIFCVLLNLSFAHKNEKLEFEIKMFKDSYRHVDYDLEICNKELLLLKKEQKRTDEWMLNTFAICDRVYNRHTKMCEKEHAQKCVKQLLSLDLVLFPDMNDYADIFLPKDMNDYADIHDDAKGEL